eukprot:m.179883 g.179883  ORF g.179883 m.179883 type:complete len:72 (+) comp16605_c0_seq2:963-1178(+)
MPWHRQSTTTILLLLKRIVQLLPPSSLFPSTFEHVRIGGLEEINGLSNRTLPSDCFGTCFPLVLNSIRVCE